MQSNSQYGEFDQAVRQFAEYPWGVLNFDNGLLERLVSKWYGDEADTVFLDAALREFARTDGPVLVFGVDLAALLLGILAAQSGRPATAVFDDEEAGKRSSQALETAGVLSVHVVTSTALADRPGHDDHKAVLVVGRHATVQAGYPALLLAASYAARLAVVLAVDIGAEADAVKRISEATNRTATLAASADGYTVLHYGQSDASNRADSDMPEVSVGIPTYNSESSIGKSIDSILSQSYPRVTLHISDNASTDATPDVCLDYVRRNEGISYYRLPENIGVFRNYNEVFRKSRSPYFKWLSSNDWVDPAFLSSCIDVLESNPDVVLVYPSVDLINADGVREKYLGDFSLEMDDPAERFIFLLQNLQLCNLFNGVYRTAAMQQTRLNGVYRGSDGILMAELALRGKFVLLPEVLWSRSMTESTSTKLRSSEEKKQFFKGTPQNYDQRIQLKYTHALFSSVLKADIALPSKLRCLVYLCRRTIWARGELLSELLPKRSS